MLYRALIIAALIGATAFADNLDSKSFQSNVTGVVRNLAGYPVSGARVDIRNIMTGGQVATTYTGSNGAFELPNVPAGNYEVVVTDKLSESHERVELSGGTVNVTLKVRDDAAGAPGTSATVSVAQMKVPDIARKHLEKAQDAFGKHKVEVARAEIDKALGIYPDYAQALTLRGILKLQSGDESGAESDLTKSVHEDYGYALGYIALGSLYNMKRQYDRAIDSLNRALVLQPQTWQGYFELSKAELGKGVFGNALKYVNKAAALIGKDWGPLHLIRGHAFLGMRDYKQATSELEAYLKDSPSEPGSAEVRSTLDKLKALNTLGVGGGQ